MPAPALGEEGGKRNGAGDINILFLAVWAKGAASAADYRAEQRSFAIGAGLSLVTVNLQKRSVAVVLAFGL